MEITQIETVHCGWAKYLIATVRLADGRTFRREIEHHGSAACVLPYHPERRTAVLVINGDLRQKNARTIANYSKQSAPEIFWGGAAFHPFTNTAVEAAFADQRAYVYDGKEVDRQTHLGFDLARVVNSHHGR